MVDLELLGRDSGHRDSPRPSLHIVSQGDPGARGHADCAWVPKLDDATSLGLSFEGCAQLRRRRQRLAHDIFAVKYRQATRVEGVFVDIDLCGTLEYLERVWYPPFFFIVPQLGLHNQLASGCALPSPFQ